MNDVNVPININGVEKVFMPIFNALGITARGITKNTDAVRDAKLKDAEAERQEAVKNAETYVTISKILKTSDALQERMSPLEFRKLNNTISTISKISDYIDEAEVLPDENISQDWANRWVSITGDISDSDVQERWAQILAGEIKKPKSYSLRTLNVLQNISTEELQLFMRIANNFMVSDFICSERACNISIRDTQKLTDAGLLNAQEVTKPFTPNANVVITSDWLIIFEAPKRINIDARILTTAGIELLQLCPIADNVNFLNNLASALRSKGATKVVKHKIEEWTKEGPYKYHTVGVNL